MSRFARTSSRSWTVLLFFVTFSTLFLAFIPTSKSNSQNPLHPVRNAAPPLIPSSTVLLPVRDPLQQVLSSLEVQLSVPNSSNLILDIDEARKSSIIAAILGLGGEIRQLYEEHPQIAVYVPEDNLTAVANVPGILQAWKDRVFKGCLNVSVPIIKPSAAWGQVEAYFGLPINGSGITIAVLDTGVDANHYDLYPRVIMNSSYVQFEGPEDLNGHGTHIAGIIAGNGNRSAGKFVGVAPAAWIQNFKVLNQFAVGYESAVLKAMEDAVGNDTDIINLSLATEESGNGDDPYSQKVEWVVAQGIPVIAAAGGNEDQFYNVSCPGVCSSAITVGCSDDFDNLYNTPYGPVLSPSFEMKPDVVAPGWHIISCRSALAGGFGYPINTFYTQVSGTSMSTAHVTGIVALMKQVHGSWTPKEFKDALMGTAEDLSFNPFQQGSGRVYAPRAINATLLVDGSLNFKLVKLGDNITKNLTVKNIDSVQQNIMVTHGNADFTITSQFNVSPSSTVEVPVTLTPLAFTSHQNYDRVTLAFGSKQVHSMLTFLHPTTTVNVPAIYANTTLTGKCEIDTAITYNYTNYRTDIYINGSFFESQFLNATGWFNSTPYLFEKAYYNVTNEFFDPDGNYLYEFNQLHFVNGLDTSFTVNIAPLIIGFATTGTIVFDDPTVSGVVVITLISESRQGVINVNINNGKGEFWIIWGIMSENNPIEVWPVVASYLGSNKHNLARADGAITVYPQLQPGEFEFPLWLLLTIIGVCVLAAVMVVKVRAVGDALNDLRERWTQASETKKEIRRLQEEISFTAPKNQDRKVKVMLNDYVEEFLDEHLVETQISENLAVNDAVGFLRTASSIVDFSALHSEHKISYLTFFFTILDRLGFKFTEHESGLKGVLDLSSSNCLDHVISLSQDGKFEQCIAFHERVKFFVPLDSVTYYEFLEACYKEVFDQLPKETNHRIKMLEGLVKKHHSLRSFRLDELDWSAISLPHKEFYDRISRNFERGKGNIGKVWELLHVAELYKVRNSQKEAKLRKSLKNLEKGYTNMGLPPKRLSALLEMRDYEAKKLVSEVGSLLNKKERDGLDKFILTCLESLWGIFMTNVGSKIGWFKRDLAPQNIVAMFETDRKIKELEINKKESEPTKPLLDRKATVDEPVAEEVTIKKGFDEHYASLEDKFNRAVTNKNNLNKNALLEIVAAFQQGEVSFPTLKDKLKYNTLIYRTYIHLGKLKRAQGIAVTNAGICAEMGDEKGSKDWLTKRDGLDAKMRQARKKKKIKK